MFTSIIRKSIIGLAAVALISMSGSAFAATDGTVGSTSTGDLDINLVIPNLIQVSSMSDIDLGSWNGSGAKTGSDTICVYDNSGGNYNATFTGNGSGSAFTLSDGSHTIAYTVTYSDGGIASAVTSGTALTGQTGADQSSFTCATGGLNGTITVEVPQANMEAAAANTYSGTLTMVVAPE